ncbi:unnamed protein product, partial [Brassica rapa subsp. trilocularis]
IGINHIKDQFWVRVEAEYQKSEIFSYQLRPRRSLQTRMTTILSAVSKLRGCVNQIENKNPSFDPESSPSPGMNSFDLNINSEEDTSNLSSRPMSLKKAKRK